MTVSPSLRGTLTVKMRIDWCSSAMARQACGRWHYSRSSASGRRFRLGVWEEGRFVGALVFGDGAAPLMAQSFGVRAEECLELVRVALDSHVTPVSRINATAIRMLRKQVPSLRVIVSFADPQHGHHGGIYQAGNWIYLGVSNSMSGRWLRVNGRVRHPKSIYAIYGTRSVAWLRANVDPEARRVDLPAKHKYALPLDAAMRRQLEAIAKPYPKRAESIAGDAPRLPVGNEGGSSPTSALNDLFYDSVLNQEDAKLFPVSDPIVSSAVGEPVL